MYRVFNATPGWGKNRFKGWLEVVVLFVGSFAITERFIDFVDVGGDKIFALVVYSPAYSGEVKCWNI